MSNSNTNPLTIYLNKWGITISSTQSGKGFNINNPTQVENPDELQQLVQDFSLGWDMTPFHQTSFDPKTGGEIKGSLVRYYCGPKVSKFDKSKEDVNEFLTSLL